MYYLTSNEWVHKILWKRRKKTCLSWLKISDKVKEKLNIKFHSERVYDEKYIKTKVRESDGVIKTKRLSNKVPKEGKHYTCIACIDMDSVMRMENKNYPQVYLETRKYKIKKTQASKFEEAELESESESEPDTDLELNSDSEPGTG